MKKNSRIRAHNGKQQSKGGGVVRAKYANKVTIGLDLGDRNTSFTVLDTSSGGIVEQGRTPTKGEALRELLGRYQQAEVGFETGTHCRWVGELVEECGHEAVIGHARKLRSIYENQHKNDDHDGEQLARILRLDRKLFHPVQLRSPEAQADLSVVRARAVLVEARTELINTARSLAKNFGCPLPVCSTPAFVDRVTDQIPAVLRPAVEPLLSALKGLNESIGKTDQRIDDLAEKKYPVTWCLKQVKGVGNQTALTYVLTLGERERFRSSRDVGVYLGLTPPQDQSGESEREKRISKAGNRYLRKLLVQSAHYILGRFGPDTALRRFGQRLIAAGGGTKKAKKRAAVAVARKLAVLLHKLWGGEIYEPLHGIPSPVVATAK